MSQVTKQDHDLSALPSPDALSAIHTLEGLLPYLPPPKQDEVGQLIRTLHRTQTDEYMTAKRTGWPHEIPRELVLTWGQKVRERREAVNLSRQDLARFAGVSTSTLKNLECGHHVPSRSVLQRLLSVTELGLSELMDLGVVHAEGPTLNCWLAPGFDSLKMLKEMVMLVNGRGGRIEQSYLYLDHMSAACWCAITDQESYTTAPRSMALARAAAQILRCTGGAGLDVLALGCGDGKLEVKLVQHLLERVEHGDLRLNLLDISQPLLSVAYKHAADTLADRRGVSVSAIQGNFHHLPCYTQLLYAPQRAHRRRVICMLGGTFHNLENEIHFVRDSLVGFAAGDLLLVEFSLVAAPSDQPQEIWRKDPRLAGKIPAEWTRRFDEWLGGPFKRYVKSVTDVGFSMELETNCPVPGSYAVHYMATIKATGSADRRFSVHHWSRYDVKKLIECLRPLGWDAIDGLPYGDDPSLPYPRVFYLFRRRGAG